MEYLDDAKIILDEFDGNIITVTGSIGKSTTTKVVVELLKKIEHNIYHCNICNMLNGISKKIVSTMPLDSSNAVFEVATNGGYNKTFEALSGTLSGKLLKPTISIFTTLAPSHMASVDSLEEMAQRKVSFLKEIPKNGYLIINRKTPCYEILTENLGVNILTYGDHAESDLKLMGFDYNQVNFSLEGLTYSFKVNHIPKEMQINFLGAILAVKTLYPEKWQATLEYFETHQPITGRGNRFSINYKGMDIHVIDDSHNANSNSIIMALENLKDLQTEGRKVVVLSEILESGKHSILEHQKVINKLDELDFDKVFLIGNVYRKIKHDYLIFDNVETLESKLFRLLKPNDTVLFKGSKNTGLNRYVRNKLLGNNGAKKANSKSQFLSIEDLANTNNVNRVFSNYMEKIAMQMGKKTERITNMIFKVGNVTFTGTSYNSPEVRLKCLDKFYIREYMNDDMPKQVFEPTKNMIIKPAKGSKAKGVLMGNYLEIPSGYIAEERIEGDVYRVLVVEGEVISVVKTIIPSVIGDGKKTVWELAQEIDFGDNHLYDVKVRGSLLGYVPKVDEHIKVHYIHNIEYGNFKEECLSTVEQSIIDLALKAVSKIEDLHVSGVDIIYSDKSHKLYLLELNHCPGVISHYFPHKGKPVDVLRKIVESGLKRIEIQ